MTPEPLQLDRIREANRRYVDAFEGTPLDARPARHLALLTCMDARLDLFRELGLAVGDAHIVRNAGGRATDDALRSLALSAHKLETREFGVIHHTECGLHGASNDELRRLVSAGSRAAAVDVDFLPFDDLDASVTADVTRVIESQLLPPEGRIWGAVIDAHHGELRVVCEPVPLG
ncbi:MAG: carbonic anhydrase [Acidimicrobiia bacterium]